MNYTQRLAEANLVPSVGSVGNSYDNALSYGRKWVMRPVRRRGDPVSQ